MKKFFLIFITTWALGGGINEQITDIYFGNGVWNDVEGAKNGRNELSEEILESVYEGDLEEFKKYHFSQRDNPDDNENIVLLQYNWTGLTPGSGPNDLDIYFGKFWDLVEMFDQLQKEGQVPNFTFFGWLQNSQASPLREWFDKYLISIDGANVRKMRDRYMDISFSKSHRVFLISHSQGNAFANRIYDAISPIGYRKYFANLQIASPVSSIHAKNSSYVTLIGDKIINPIPGSMIGNVKLNPEDNKVLDVNHELVSEYLRQTDPITMIIKRLNFHIVSLENISSQWNSKNKGCTCKDKHVTVTHKFDDESTILMNGKKVKDFTSVSGGESKIYAVTLNGKEQYIKASSGGASIEEISEDNSDLCYKLKNDEATVIGEVRGIDITSTTAQAGALKMTLSWNYQCDIDMDLTMRGNDAVIYDIQDVKGAGKEHLVIPSLFDIKPGDHYVFNANGEQLPDSELTEEILAEDPIEIRALLETTKGDYFNVWPVESFNSLNIGDFAEVNVYETIQPKWVCPAISNTPGWHRPYNNDTGNFQCLYCPSPYSIAWEKPPYSQAKGTYYCNRPRPRIYTGGSSGGRTYNECSEEEKKSTCGCVPCDYIVSGLKKRIENGPIAGASVEIIKASDVDGINPAVLYRGRTTDTEDIFQSGLLEIPDATLDTFEDNAYYLILAEGGRDIDRDDDMVRDSIPTDNNGTIHALLKGSDLKRLPFRVNILTEAIYQVSGESIGLHYDAVALQTKLDAAAQKLINHKLYPGDEDSHINYKDVLLWTPAVDKKALYKPFTTYVEPLIESLYADRARFDESYRLIYEPYESDAPQLQPLSLEISEGLDNGIIIAQIKTHNHKTFEHIVVQGNFSEHFSVDNEGYIQIAQHSLIEEGNRYRLQMKAVDAAGWEGSFVSLTIQVKGKITQSDPMTSTPRFISAETVDIQENAAEGTVVAHTYFEDSNQTIVSYRLSGEHHSSFSVDGQGVVTVSASADIDYEKSKIYRFAISAMNDAGNESYPIIISVPVVNLLDTPLFDLVVFEHIEENIPIGSAITTIRTDREGLGNIEKFEILSPNIPFTIDNNGTLSVSNYIDYEQVKQYDFYAIARTKYGNSNKIEIHIVVDDQDPEIGIPGLEALRISVDENASSGSKIGQLTLDAGATVIERIALYGEDANFRVDNNGSIYLSSDAKLDYETKTRYDLGARALNSRGYGNEVHIVINVNNIADEMPKLDAFRAYVEEDTSVGTVIGTVQIGPEAEASIDFILLSGEGHENFTIDVNGAIRVNAVLDYETQERYYLKAIASSVTGFNVEAEVMIDILNIAEFVPVLKVFSGKVEESVVIGSIVGSVEVEHAGDTPVVSFDINESDVFSINAEGVIFTHQEINWSTSPVYSFHVTANNDAGRSEFVEARVEVLRNNYLGGVLADTFTGSSRNEYFNLGDGDDVVYANAGADRLIGGRGNDILNGGTGDDVYIYTLGDGNDTIVDIQGEDRLILQQIDKETLSFTLSSSSLTLHIGEDNSTIEIENWKNDDQKIEEIVFDNGEKFTLADFDLPIVEPDAGIVDLSKLGNSNALQVVEGKIVPVATGYDSVDHWIFNYEGGNLEIDLLSELANNGQTYIDIDRDGKQTGVDVYIYLYKRDQNGNWRNIAGNDDSSSGRADGSSHHYDSYLNMNLAEGEYMLAVSNFNLSASTALGDRNTAGNYPNGGPYQITFNATLVFTEFPQNANNNLYGSDHYNFYVLRNDIDPYNFDGLSIENPVIMDENGSESSLFGSVQSNFPYISYYPEEAFSDINESVEVNIVYDVSNKNGISTRSLLTLKVIPTLYTHIEPTVNQLLWENMEQLHDSSELNISKE